MRTFQFASIVAAILLATGCTSSDSSVSQAPAAGSASAATGSAVDEIEPQLSADEALWQARNAIAPELNAASGRFEKYLQAKGASSDLSRRQLAMQYACEAERLNRFDVAIAEMYYATPIVDGNGNAEGPTVYDILENGDRQMLERVRSADLASCANRDAIVAMW